MIPKSQPTPHWTPRNIGVRADRCNPSEGFRVSISAVGGWYLVGNNKLGFSPKRSVSLEKGGAKRQKRSQSPNIDLIFGQIGFKKIVLPPYNHLKLRKHPTGPKSFPRVSMTAKLRPSDNFHFIDVPTWCWDGKIHHLYPVISIEITGYQAKSA